MPEPSATDQGKRAGWARSVAWNLAGALLPLLAGLVSIPLLVERLGIERFGLLNLAWLLAGYFSLFDFGLSRALTRLVAARLEGAEQNDIPSLIVSAMRLMAGLGVLAALVTVCLGLTCLDTWLAIPPALQGEMTLSVLLLAAALPFVVLAAGWRGVLEASQRFDWVNWVRIPLGVALFVLPLLALQFAEGLVPVVAALTLTRVLGWLAHRWQCNRLWPTLAKGRFERRWLAPLFSFGGWLTVSNLVGPLMVYADRFMIGGLVSLTAVAYYATPYEIVTRLWILSAAATGVLFPRLSAELGDRIAAAARSYRLALAGLSVSVLPLIAFMMLLAPEGLRLWVGDDFAREGSTVARILTAGVFINILGQVALTMLHAAGRAEWSARVHLLELPLYGLALYFLGRHFGIEGIALAWLLRILLDTVIMLTLAEKILQSQPGRSLILVLLGVLALCVPVAGCALTEWTWRLGLAGLLCLLCWGAPAHFLRKRFRQAWVQPT